MFDISVITGNWAYFARGIGMTILITTAGMLLGFGIGFLVALLRTATLLPLRIAVGIYVEVLRNIPFIILLFIFFYGLPFAGIRIPSQVAGTVALALFCSAYYAEILRGAMAAVPSGQIEAARAMGLTHLQILRDIIVPQMWKFALPPMAGTTTTTVKESSVLSTIAVSELTYQGLIVQGMTFAPFEVFATVAGLYWIFTAVLTWGFHRAERAVGSPEMTEVIRSKVARKYLSLDHRM